MCCSYEDTIQQPVCTTCHSPLTLVCSTCSSRAQALGQSQRISRTPPAVSTGDGDGIVKLEHANHHSLPGCSKDAEDAAEDAAGDSSYNTEDNVVSDWERMEAEEEGEEREAEEEGDESSIADSGSVETESSETWDHAAPRARAVKRTPDKLSDIVACCWCDVSFRTVRSMKSHVVQHTSVAWQRQRVSSAKSAPGPRSQTEEGSTLPSEEAAAAAAANGAPPAAAAGAKAFRCIFCGVRKNNVFRFTAHLHQHTDKAAFKCLRCGVTHKSVTSLETHLRAHPPKSDEEDEARRASHPHQCRICGLRFMHLGGLANHAEKHAEPNPFSCWKCLRAFQLLSDLTGHRCLPAGGRSESEDAQAFPGFVAEGVSLQQSQDETPLAHRGEVLKQAEEEHRFPAERPVEEAEGQRTWALTEAVSRMTEKPEAESRVPALHDEGATTRDAVPESQSRYSSGCVVPDAQDDHSSGYTVPELTQAQHSAEDTTSGTQQELSSEEVSVERSEKSQQPKPESGARRGRKRRKKQLQETGRQFRCPDCPSAFKSLATLTVHSQRHTGQKAFPCPQCDQSFTSDSKRLRHQEKDHWGSTPITCYECGKVVASQRSLDEHVRCHTGERPHACHTCGERFKNRSALNRHRGKHKASFFKCSVCGAGYHYSSAYSAHMKTHAAVKPHLCPTCGESFFQLRELSEHALKHGQKQFVCEHCGKAFYTKASHKMHALTHLGVKPFSCDVCGKSFVARNKLRVHHSRVHVGARPYGCHLCDAAYAVVSRLNEHIRATHTSERPYKCSFCDKTFAKSGCRQAHLRTHIKN